MLNGLYKNGEKCYQQSSMMLVEYMQNYDNLSTQEVLDKVQQHNTGSVVTTTSATVSAILLPIIRLINKIGCTNNTNVLLP